MKRNEVIELAESWHNGNRNEVWQTIVDLPAAQAVGVAMHVAEHLRGQYGISAYRDFNVAMRERAEG